MESKSGFTKYSTDSNFDSSSLLQSFSRNLVFKLSGTKVLSSFSPLHPKKQLFAECLSSVITDKGFLSYEADSIDSEYHNTYIYQRIFFSQKSVILPNIHSSLYAKAFGGISTGEIQKQKSNFKFSPNKRTLWFQACWK